MKPVEMALILCALVLLPFVADAAEQSTDSGLVGEADAVYRNGFVYTVDGVRSRAEAFAVRDGKYLKVGPTMT